MGLELEERDVFLDEISRANEVWYISSTKELQPVATIDDIDIKYDKENLIWHSVLTEYVQSINL
jgi:branched-subunit amino acid aminotransferase/4-amino-4-deoxychorismate lyase